MFKFNSIQLIKRIKPTIKKGIPSPQSKQSKKLQPKYGQFPQNSLLTQNIQSMAVDLYFPHSLNYRVLRESSLGFYSITLNKSDLANDNNKFYIIQVLQSIQAPQNTNQPEYYVFMRWGRVGIVGQISTSGPMLKFQAIKLYRSKVQDRIKRGEYKIIETLTDNPIQQEIQSYLLQCKPEPPSHLSEKVQDLIRLIFDFRMMSSHMREIGYDNKRSPLGLLAKGSIDRGYLALDKLLETIKAPKGTSSQTEKKKRVSEYSGQFYSAIPHDFGYMNMQTFILDTEEKIKQKLQMLASLTQIQVCSKLLNDKSNPEPNSINQIDLKYSKLKITIKELPKVLLLPSSSSSPSQNLSQDSLPNPQYQSILKYVQNTQGKSHKYSLEVLQIFSIRREEEEVRYVGDTIGNKMMLWHGSRLTNFVGILSEGLKIAPYEAPMTGYMFGKGIYFADVVSKAANYCLPSRVNNVGLLLLCEVALGETRELLVADYTAHHLPAGKHSTHGVGQNTPNGGQHLASIWMPNGPIEPSETKDSALLYNQYVVYRREQIKCKYLVKVKFIFK